MSLLDDLKNPPKRSITFTEWLNRQTAEIVSALEQVAVDEEWSDYGLEQLLRKHHAPVSKESIRAWRSDVATR